MNRRKLFVLLVLVFYWLNRTICVFLELVIIENRYQDILMAIMGFISELFLGWVFIPFNLIVFYVFISKLLKYRKRWHEYIAWKPLLASGILLQTIGVILLFLPDGHKSRDFLVFFSIDSMVFWIYFILGNLIFMAIASWLWFYKLKVYFESMIGNETDESDCRISNCKDD